MKLLLLILSVLTLTVKSKKEVSATGDVPEGMNVTYACTYQKGDVRANDTATLNISGMGGMEIEQIDVYLTSNKTAGAGVITMKADGQQIYAIDGTFKDWFGAYNKTDSLPITWTGEQTLVNGTLEVQVVGTTNSLHIKNYVITYSKAETTPYSVTLMVDGTEYEVLTEKAGGKGIDLPWVDNISSWEFEGWSETEFWDTEAISPVPLLYPGEKYYPQEDCTLWAVYKQDRTPAMSYVTDLTDDVYLYMNNKTHLALSGVPADGIMEVTYVNVYDDQQYYLIEFQGTDTAYITHMMSETPIGYSNNAKLIASASPWKVYHDGEETLFYAIINNKPYLLWLSMTDEYVENVHAGLLQADPMSSPMRLQSTLMPAQLYMYTCHPGKAALEDVKEEGREYIVPLGNYNLKIINGKKYLELR